MLATSVTVSPSSRSSSLIERLSAGTLHPEELPDTLRQELVDDHQELDDSLVVRRYFAKFARITGLLREHGSVPGIQLAHAGRKGSTNRGWPGYAPGSVSLADGGWQTVSTGTDAFPGYDAPRALETSEIAKLVHTWAQAAKRAVAAGFDCVEVHAAHGYLLHQFMSPLTNQRSDAYGGSLENRLRYPLEVFAAVRAAWPQELPMSVRISAHDWVEGGITPADAVEIARAFKTAGADMIDCSSGQVSAQQKPTYGRMYQTPFADRIRQEAGVATIAVGAISEADHVNSILAAGRADLCAVARPHLANPAWTLNEAARIGYSPIAWPQAYVSGKSQLEAGFARERALQSATKGD